MENKKNLIKKNEFSIFLHGTLIEVFGKGVLIRGESSSGKSSLAFELIKKGHRFIADDLVKIKKNDFDELVGLSSDNEKFIEIRPFGIFDVTDVFGRKAVKESQKIDFIVDLSKNEKTDFMILDICLKLYQIDFSCDIKKVCCVEKLALLEGKEKRFFINNNNSKRKNLENTKNCICEK